MKYFTLIILLVFTSLVGCSSEGEGASEIGLTEEGVHKALMKCLEAENKSTLVKISPIYIENNSAEGTFGYNRAYTFHLKKDIKGDWYLVRVLKSNRSFCGQITPLLVE